MIHTVPGSANMLSAYLVDTNVLLRWSLKSDPQHEVIRRALDTLQVTKVILYVAPQTVAEYWNVLTRPANKNGFGFTPEEVEAETLLLEASFVVLEDSLTAYREWRRLVRDAKVSGVQVHDARLAALMISHGLTHLLTFNARDFARYGVTPIDPATI